MKTKEEAEKQTMTNEKNMAEISGHKLETRDENNILMSTKYIVKIKNGKEEVKIQIGEANYEAIKKLFI